MAVQIRQEINILDHILSAAGGSSATSNEIIQLDTTKYNGATYYFEIEGDSSVSLSFNVTLNGATDGTLATCNIPLLTTAYALVRSSSFVPTTATQNCTVVIDATAGATKNVKAARIVIIQNPTTLTITETQIEVGNLSTTTSLTSVPLTNPKYWKYTAANWDGTQTFYFEATFKNGTTKSAATASLQVADGTGDGFTGWADVATSPVTTTSITAVRVRSAAITLTDGRWYRVAIKSSSTKETVTIYNAKVIVGQQSGVGGTTLELNSTSLISDASLVSYWRLEGNSNDAKSSNNGTDISITYSTGNGKFGQGAGFNSASPSSIAVTGLTAVASTKTYNAWIKTSGAGAGFAQIIGLQNKACLFLNTNVLVTYDWGASAIRDTGVNLADDLWHMVSLVSTNASSNGTFIYIDGELVLTTTLTATTVGTPCFMIGAQGSNDATPVQQFFTGAIDDASYFSRILTASEIRALYYGSFTKLEPQYLLANTLFAAGTALQTFLTKWDSTEWSGVTNTYTFQAEAANGSTSDVTLEQADGGGTVTNSTLTNIDNAQISSAITMPGNENLDTKATTNAGDVAAARILVAVVVPSTAAISDSITVTESVTVTVSTPDTGPNKSDTVTVTESVTMQVTKFINVFDAITVTENVNVTLVSDINVFDSVTVNETVLIVLISNINVNDAITATESVVMSGQLGDISVNDAITVTESVTMQVTSFISVLDTITITELVNVAQVYDLSVNDTVTVTEAVVMLVTSFPNVFEAVTVTENINITLVSLVSVFDAVGVTESVIVEVVSDVFAISVNDVITVSESVTLELTSFVSVSEVITVAESVVLQLNSFINVFDSVAITESINLAQGYNISVFEAVTVTENFVGLDTLFISVSETITITEFISVVLVSDISVSEAVSVAESVSIVLISNISVFDAITVIANNISTSLGPLIAGTGTGTGWTTPENITANDGLYASVGLEASSSDYLKGTNFGFNVPSYATVKGIVVSWVWNQTGGGPSVSVDASRLIKGGVVGSTDRFYGSSTDLWGDSWTPADINASNFGAAIIFGEHNGNVKTVNVDYVTITVYYEVTGVIIVEVSTSVFAFDSVSVVDSVVMDVQSADTRQISVSDSITVTDVPTLQVNSFISVFDSILVRSDNSPLAWSTNYAGTGGGTWANPGNVTGAPDLTYATASIDSGSSTGFLEATNFGFTLPSDAIISGIEVAWNITSTGGGTYSTASRLIKGGVIGSTDKYYGGPTELWGDTWTPANVNASNFGAAISYTSTDTVTRNFFADSITITVYYYPAQVVVELNSFISVSEAITVSEFTNETLVHNISVSDSISVSESVIMELNSFISVSDSVSVTEFVNLTKIYDISVNDAITVTEAVILVVISNISVSESITVSESVTLEVNSFISVSDAITVTESVSLTQVYDISVFDSVSVTENVSMFETVSIFVFEAITVTEGITVVIQAAGTFIVNVDDTVIVSEFVALEVNSFISVSDSITVTDVSNVAKVYDINVFDSISVTEAVSLTKIYDISVFEAVTVSESVTVSFDLNVSVFDSVSVTESVNVLFVNLASVSDSVTVSEFIAVQVSISISVFDAITISETVVLEANNFINVSETIPVSESVSLTQVYNISVSETITVSESVTLELNSFISVVDAVTVSENFAPQFNLVISVFDSISVAESFTVNPSGGDLAIFVSETLTVTESLAFLISVSIEVSDSITVAESVTVSLVNDISVSESITVTESVSLQVSVSINVFDTVTVSENFAEQLPVGGNVFDAITVSEAVSLTLVYVISVSDSITVSESVSLTFSFGISTYDTITVTDIPEVFVKPFIKHKHKPRMLGEILSPTGIPSPLRIKSDATSLKIVGTRRPGRELPTERQHG